MLLAILLPYTVATPVAAETYITEENVQIDRCACAWFISRYLDETPTFTFIKQGQTPPKGVTYDFFGADYFHRGPDCSFTGFIKKHIKQKNTALIELNTVVNDVFAWRNGPNSLSVAIKRHIDYLSEQGKTDTQIYQASLTVFDLLYLTKKGNDSAMNKSGKKSLASAERQVLSSIYGKNIPLTPNQVSQLKKACNTPPLNTKLLNEILTSSPTKHNSSLHSLTLKILKSNTTK